MKKINLILAMALGLFMLLSVRGIASDDPFYEYWQNQQRQQRYQREKVIHLITIDSNGSTVRIQCGDEIQLKLQENETTGYSWHFDELGFEIVSDSQEKMNNLIGSPTMHIWIFRPGSLAEKVIKMSYYRTWEGKRPDSQLFEVKIVADCTFR
jgi:inhibitor of cysteine peptidase